MRARVAVAAVLLVAALAGAAGAAEWGLIRPGISTMGDVRGRYGAPTRTLQEKIEGYQTERWIYEGSQAPSGIDRLTVEFGLVQSEKFRPEVVRAFRLEPRPGTFNRGIIDSGWGVPDQLWREGDEERALYKDGLLVHFEPAGWEARLLIFTVPQPRDPTEERR
jgi:hypothetical protein